MVTCGRRLSVTEPYRDAPEGPLHMRHVQRPAVPILRFLGATETVTGSRFVIDTPHARVLVDCGLFQGLKALRLCNWEPFPVAPESIDALLLTHAHLDHTGYLTGPP